MINNGQKKLMLAILAKVKRDQSSGKICQDIFFTFHFVSSCRANRIIIEYPFDSTEDPNGQDVGHDAQEPSEGYPDAHHGEEVDWGRRHSHHVQGAGGGHVHVMVTHVAYKLDTIVL